MLAVLAGGWRGHRLRLRVERRRGRKGRKGKRRKARARGRERQGLSQELCEGLVIMTVMEMAVVMVMMWGRKRSRGVWVNRKKHCNKRGRRGAVNREESSRSQEGSNPGRWSFSSMARSFRRLG